MGIPLQVGGNRQPETDTCIHSFLDTARVHVKTDQTELTRIPKIGGCVVAGNLVGIVDRTYSLEEVVDAHEYVEQGHKTGNVVLKPVA